MEDRTYKGTLSVLRHKLAQALVDVDPALHTQIIDELARQGALTIIPKPLPNHRCLDPILGSDRYYAVHDSELRLYRSLGMFLSIGTGGVAGGMARIAGLIAFWLHYKKIRIELSGEQAAVLFVLKEAENVGVAPEQIADGRPMTVEQVISILQSLLSIRRANGISTALVEQIEGGHWIRLDV